MKKWLFLIFLLLDQAAHCQPNENLLTIDQPISAAKDSLRLKHPGRLWLTGGSTVAGYGGSFIFLSAAWYKGYPKSAFHTFNDVGEWLQIDKTGHAWTAYTASRLTTGMWEWAGMSHTGSVALASGSALLYMLSIEYLDGRSAEWGWSWGDAGADVIGAALFASQALAWKEQKIQLKFSTHYASYDPTLEPRVKNLFGNSVPERFLKDYNAQSYWLSVPLCNIFPDARLPKWLSIAVGYGAEGMFGGFSNVAYDKDGNLSFDRRDIRRYRQWYLAPDIDLTKIRTHSHFMRSLLKALNALKIPAPALELSRGRLRGHVLYF